jgi:para-aminobenzoate synthetase / 4-amino-4-deoxychorismate lyase
MNQLSTATPFVLLDDARAEGAASARLYTNPIAIIMTHDPNLITAKLAEVKASQNHVAGFLAYEAGNALEPRLAAAVPKPSTVPLLWFAVFESYSEIAPDAVANILPAPIGGWVGAPQPRIDNAAYEAALTKTKGYIAAGDIYQANLTFNCDVPLIGDPLALYSGLRTRAKAGYGGIVWTGEDWLLSLSPELFFALKDGKLTTKPMKGTAMRGGDQAADAQAAAKLQSDPKQRAENLMIVDLLRNDLSRVTVPGSVAVPQLFHVETYPTVHQMTSTVTARLRDDLDVWDALGAIFPCGSITGAPKIRAMEVIGEIEGEARGAYTGSIGRIDPNGDAAFNVAIRTLHLRKGANCATMGLGSGIIADSESGDEWRECLAKGGFVPTVTGFDLFETMRFDPSGGIKLLDRHIARIGDSAKLFGFPFDRHAARNELQAATFRIAESRRVRLMLSPSGRIAIEIQPHQLVPADVVEVSLMPLPVDVSDFRLRHKTTDRSFYVEARSAAGTFEVALVDPDGFITEGSFTNIFVRGPGALLTPPLSRGLLPGVLRAELIANGSAVEADLRREDLAEPFFIGNASRGLIPARLVDQG